MLGYSNVPSHLGSVCMTLSDLLQNLNLALQDVPLIREVFHELLVSAAKHSRYNTCFMNIN